MEKSKALQIVLSSWEAPSTEISESHVPQLCAVDASNNLLSIP